MMLDPSMFSPQSVVGQYPEFPNWLMQGQAMPWGMSPPAPGEVPLPRTRPQGAPQAEAMPAAMPMDAGAPMSLAPPTQAAAPAAAPSFFSRLGSGINDNANTLMALGAGMAGSGSIGEGISRGLSAAQQGSQLDQTQKNQNMTVAALMKRGVAEDVARTAVANPEILKQILPSAFGAKQYQFQKLDDGSLVQVDPSGKEPAKTLLPGGGAQTDDIKEYNFAIKQGFKGSLQDWMQRKRAGAGEYGLQPIWGAGTDGKPALVQLGKSGEAIQSKLPEGFVPAKDPMKVDLGTHWGIMDPQTRQFVGTISKNVVEKEAQEKEGQALGTARVALPAAESTTTRAVKMLDELEKHPGLGDGVGFIMGRLPALTPKAADFRERVEQVDAMVFGDAVEVMRGLGALTDKEGPKITAARARLKTAKSEEDYRTALKDVREVFQTGIENMRKKAGAAPAAAKPDPLGIR